MPLRVGEVVISQQPLATMAEVLDTAGYPSRAHENSLGSELETTSP